MFNSLDQTVRADVFAGLWRLTHLDLSNNQMTVLTNATFSHLPSLTWLSLRSNRLHALQTGAMQGLGNLTFLDLTFNQLQPTPQSFPPGVFAPLSSLRHLRLYNNVYRHHGRYPEGVFNHLVSLRYLALDTYSTVHFGPDFTALRQIETLDLTYNCRLNHLLNTSFEGFRNSSLQVISVQSCRYAIQIDACTFCDLPNLKHLRIANLHHLPVPSAFKALHGLRGQNMTEILFSEIGDWGKDTYRMGREEAESLSDVCVQSFTLQQSRIRLIAKNSIPFQTSRFAKCIENIDFSGNILQGDFRFFILALSFFHRLRTAQFQNQNIFSVQDSACVLSNKCSYHTFPHQPSFWSSSIVTIPTPPDLQVLYVSGCFKHLNPLPGVIQFQPGHSLQALDLSYNVMANCVSTVMGLDNLVTLKLNYNYCKVLSTFFFDHLHNLRHLELSNFGAETPFYVGQGQRLFRNLTKLETLDLSFNDLSRLDPVMLHRQTHLTSLDLSRNRFQSLPVFLRYHGNLSSLDLSHNNIPSLSVENRRFLDSLARRHDIRVQLQGNPLTCTCSNLDMVDWLFHTSVSLDGQGRRGNYSCTTETGEITDTHHVMVEMTSHWRRCVGVGFFALALSLFLIQLLLTAVVYIVYRSWSQLCYAWKALRRQRLPDRLKDFSKDVYFVYADTDRDVFWACQTLAPRLRQHGQLRILLRNEEQQPGADRVESIGQHIEKSWKTLLLVTRDFCRDEWACSISIQQALLHVTDSTPDRIIVLFLDKARQLLTKPSLQTVLRLVPERNVFHVHPDTAEHHPVWRSLAENITGQPAARGQHRPGPRGSPPDPNYVV